MVKISIVVIRSLIDHATKNSIYFLRIPSGSTLQWNSSIQHFTGHFKRNIVGTLSYSTFVTSLKTRFQLRPMVFCAMLAFIVFPHSKKTRIS